MPHLRTSIELVDPEGRRTSCNGSSGLLEAVSNIVIPDIEEASTGAGVDIKSNDVADGVGIDILISEEEYEHNLDICSKLNPLPAKWNGTKVDGADGKAYMMSCSRYGFWFVR